MMRALAKSARSSSARPGPALPLHRSTASILRSDSLDAAVTGTQTSEHDTSPSLYMSLMYTLPAAAASTSLGSASHHQRSDPKGPPCTPPSRHLLSLPPVRPRCQHSPRRASPSPHLPDPRLTIMSAAHGKMTTPLRARDRRPRHSGLTLLLENFERHRIPVRPGRTRPPPVALLHKPCPPRPPRHRRGDGAAR